MAYTVNDVASYRVVGGKKVPIDDAERQRIADEWNARRESDAASVARISADRSEALRISMDKALMALIDATPEELLEYARKNFPTLTAQEQNKFGGILAILALAARPQVR